VVHSDDRQYIRSRLCLALVLLDKRFNTFSLSFGICFEIVQFLLDVRLLTLVEVLSEGFDALANVSVSYRSQLVLSLDQYAHAFRIG
jgi:hypothetical protein